MHRQEHAPFPVLVATVFQMGHDPLAEIAGQRQLVTSVGLPIDGDLSGTPVDVLEP